MGCLHAHCGHQRLFKAHLAVVWTAFSGLRGTQRPLKTTYKGLK